MGGAVCGGWVRQGNGCCLLSAPEPSPDKVASWGFYSMSKEWMDHGKGLRFHTHTIKSWVNEEVTTGRAACPAGLEDAGRVSRVHLGVTFVHMALC